MVPRQGNRPAPGTETAKARGAELRSEAGAVLAEALRRLSVIHHLRNDSERARAIRWHHEKFDGTGYPDRRCGYEIPLAAQVICIVEVYDALTTTRSYRPAMSNGEALARTRDTPTWWRPEVLEAFLRSVGETAAAA